MIKQYRNGDTAGTNCREQVSLMDRALWLVVTLTVRRSAIAAFEDFEQRATAIMARYDGSMEHAIRLTGDEATDTFREVHVIRFQDEPSFECYRQDAELAGLRSLRESAVVSTEIARGRTAIWKKA
jgi:antibiotic biosynthesis monooxygenase (ABM) superfamily enzyme